MAKAQKAHKSADRIEVEPGADKRLANILKKALNTPCQHRSAADAKKKGRDK